MNDLTMKMTLVNVSHKTGRHSAFVMLPVESDGKVRMNMEDIVNHCDPDRNIPRTHCIGYNV